MKQRPYVTTNGSGIESHCINTHHAALPRPSACAINQSRAKEHTVTPPPPTDIGTRRVLRLLSASCSFSVDLNANDGGPHAWDEGWAFYAGSTEGTDGSGEGFMLHQLATKRCG